MARRRRREAPAEVGLRDVLLAKYREQLERAERMFVDDWWPGFPERAAHPYRGMVQALEAGEPLVVSGWEIARLRPGVDGHRHYQVEPDGSVTLMREVHHGDVIEFVPEGHP